MEDKPPSIFRKFYEELKSGNPFVILLLLALVVALGSLWIWQITHPLKRNTPTPRFNHPSAVSPIKVMTARALSAVPPKKPSPTPVSTPKAEIFPRRGEISSVHLKHWRSFRSAGAPFFFGR